MNLILIYFAIKYKGYFHDIFNALKNKEYVEIGELNKIQKQINNNEIKAITIVDDDYPESLKNINNPPFVLFYEGNKELLNNDSIVLTGEFKNQIIQNFIDKSLFEISKYHTLISNYIKDVDEYVVNKTLVNNNNIILVSTNGIENPYFIKNIDSKYFHKNNFLLISEYPKKSNINKRRLIERNRITMGLAKNLIIASSYKNGAINNLVTNALEQGKDVYCFPGLQTDDDGNNALIQDGAKMITSIKDLRKN